VVQPPTRNDPLLLNTEGFHGNFPWDFFLHRSQLPMDRFRLIGMDQRSAQVGGGQSSGSFVPGLGHFEFEKLVGSGFFCVFC